jgi:hypothetical protein
LIKSAIFDTRILDAGEWDAASLASLRAWVESEDSADKRLRASRLIPELLERTLGPRMRPDGKIRARRIGEALTYFEDLMLTSKSGLGKKFYRDHLNHLIRVIILARAIAKQCLRIETGDVVLASLFHDIGYPVAESRTIIEGSIKALRSCFGCVQFAEHFLSYDMEKATRLTRLLNEVDTSQQLGKAFSSHEHSVVGAMEFLDYVDNPEQYVQVIEAIVFHDSSFQRRISLRGSPVLAALVLADELQDWDRPIGYDRTSAVQSIEPFEMGKGLIRGRMEASATPSFSPLRQVISKLRSLSRIVIDTPLKFELEIALPKYNEISITDLQVLASQLYNLRMKQGLNVSDVLHVEDSDSVFQEAYYGITISDAINRSIIANLESVERRPIVNGRFLFDQDRFEILHLTDMEEPKSFIITSSDESIELDLRSSGGTYRGKLSDVTYPATKATAEMVVGLVRAVNVLLRICEDARPEEFNELEYMVGREEASKILHDLGLENWSSSVGLLRGIGSTVFQKGLFCFTNS